MPNSQVSVRLEISSAALKKQVQAIIASVDGLQVSANGSGDLHFQEVGQEFESEIRSIRTLKESGEIGDLFLTSSRTEPDILIQALRAGAMEFISQPIDEKEVKDALAGYLEKRNRALAAETDRRQGKIITVLGSKGGVGTTTTAVNLASFLGELSADQKVSLIDMNLIFGEVPLFLDIEPTFGWGEVIRNFDRLDATYLKSVLSKHPSGISVLPPSPDIEAAHLATPAIIDKVFQLMRQEFDYVVIDCGQLLDAAALRILELSETVLLVSTQNLPCLINMRRILETFRQLGYPREDRIKIVMNRYQKGSTISRKAAEDGIKKKISWFIPNDYDTTMSAIHQGKMLSSVASSANITTSFRELAMMIGGKTAAKKERGRRWGLPSL
jgi:pilus assembly protein CpaE